ncbi:MAG TPA: lysophospholipid acyltransferase family protein [Bacteroidales bacterium]|jgi:KDO2-lipid IV(A) lauroyltransferase|nr:lysophospholipid acyltransferase family protein [Bacteroidales bacterium]HOX73601.1 lysophospholipid acyltransferase family protein [Bacteroidales bacterium]HPM87799.1 lysophospholipid acyltransferase family protein [Bacteroidales bacterium]
MATLGFYIFYSIVWVITLLPLRVLYLFSDLLFPLVCYFPGYRRKVVAENLRNAFPGKNEKERAIIQRRFYRHFCDLAVEILKLTHMSDKQLMRRMTINNKALPDRLYNEGRDVVAVLGHYGNWEWTSIMSRYTELRNVPIYKPLNNKHFDRFMLSLRIRNNCDPVPMSMVVREIIRNRKEKTLAMYGFISDQTPARAEIRYRTEFLNQDTPVFLGTEKIASKYDMAVVFINVQKVRRGYYTMTPELLFEHSAGQPEYLITRTHVKRLEEVIREKPEYWLWSHRRWKYKREEPNG